MAIVRILQFPDPRLKTIGKEVTDFGDATQKLIDNMFETHYAQKNCAALAATQLDFVDPPHITVIDFSEKKDQPLCLVNAEIIAKDGKATEDEGCMSVGTGGMAYEKVTRAAKITVKAQDRHGNPLNFEAEDFMAKCIQHELDHLKGVLFIDHLSALKRQRVIKQLQKIKKQQKSDQ
jgi:peptide deformylase